MALAPRVAAAVSWASAGGVAAVVIVKNNCYWPKRLLWAGLLAAVFAYVLLKGLRHAGDIFVALRHLISDHKKAFARGAVMGALGGALFTAAIWDYSCGFLLGLIMAARLAAAAGLVTGYVYAQRAHQMQLSVAELDVKLRTATGSVVVQAIFASLLLTLVAMPLPAFPPSVGPDASWSAVLTHAVEKKWQFGVDVVFTYGPLGFLTVPYRSSAGFWQILANFALTFAVGAGVFRVARRSGGLSGPLLLVAFVLFLASIHPDGEIYAATDLLIYWGILCWGVLCLTESGVLLVISAACFCALAVFGALAKASFLFTATASVAAIAVGLVCRRESKVGAILIGGYLAGFVLGWFFAGQKLTHMLAFFKRALLVSRGYNEAMTVDRGALVTIISCGATLLAFSTLAVWCLGAIRNRKNQDLWLSGMLATFLLALLFVVWKYGMVCGERYHLEVLAGFLPIFGLTVASLAPEGHSLRKVVSMLGLCTFLGALLMVDTIYFRGYSSSCLNRPFRLLVSNTRALLSPTAYALETASMWNAEQLRLKLPEVDRLVGTSRVDVFGAEQSRALFNRLNYTPRPVFQSYVAYSAPLMQLNEQFYLGASAPEFVLFHLSPIAERLPPLEDSLVLRHLLINYSLAGTEDHFVLLKSERGEPCRTTLVREGTARPGEQVSMTGLPDTGLWLEINVDATFLGRVREFLYKPSALGIRVWRAGRPEGYRFNAPAPMLHAGFLASPLVLSDQDVLDLYQGRNVARPNGYSVEFSPGGKYFWRPIMHYRVYRIENPFGGRNNVERTRN